jgi:two-component system, chemotaxis family, sensor kinase CheA
MFDEETQQALLKEFFLENRESVDQIEKYLLQLESSPENRDELLNTIFRNMHTVKGNCRMMGFEKLESLSHAAETLLELMRDNRVAINEDVGSILLDVVDSVRSGLVVIEQQQGAEGDMDFSAQIDLLARFSSQDDNSIAKENTSFASTPSLVESTGVLQKGSGGTVDRLQSIQLTIERLDDLMRMVGEAGTSVNQLRYAIREQADAVKPVLDTLDGQIQQLQGEVLKYRLQPIGRTWDGYHRLVRDLAIETRKKVLFTVEGEETEVDRNVLLAIKDLLGHLIRNAIDHGIESPEERKAKGKSSLGRLLLSAKQKDGQVIMALSDDGAGIDGDHLRNIARNKGLISERQSQEMEYDDLLKFIFHPGFSTVDQVSHISGRGTGMDVVKEAVEGVGGVVSITSKADVGSCITLRIPQTTALIPTLLVREGGVQYAIPQVNIVELISFVGQEVVENIEVKMHTLSVRVQDRILPVIRLKRVVEEEYSLDEEGDSFDLRQQKEVQMVILQADDFQFALEVERIEEPVSLVVKSLGEVFSHVKILTGAAIMPDGSVSFLLNVYELVKS